MSSQRNLFTPLALSPEEGPMTVLLRFHDELVFFFNNYKKIDPAHERWVDGVHQDLMDHLEQTRLGDPRRPTKKSTRNTLKGDR